MKHAFLVFVVAVLAYGFWHISDIQERKRAMRLVTRHIIRLGLLLLIIALMLALAVQLPATSLF